MRQPGDTVGGQRLRKPGGGRGSEPGKKAAVTRAEQEARAELALPQSECAHVDGTVGLGSRVSNERRRDLEHLPPPGHLQQGRLVTTCN